MSVINDDNDIPYNAQVFTQEQELDKYLQEKKADMLMICEGAYEYDATRTGNKTVVLCEEEQDADEINSKEERGLVGICKYQPSYQLLQSVMRCEKTSRMVLSLAVAKQLSEKCNTLFVNFETFGGFKGILKGEEEQNLSDALYAFRQNHNQFHKNIVNAISHYDRLDYIPDTSCADDIDDIKAEELGTFVQGIGRELGYSYIVDCFDEIYMCDGDNYLEKSKVRNFENMVMERGMNNIVSAFKKIAVRIEDNILNPDMWNRLPFCSFYDELCSLIETGET